MLIPNSLKWVFKSVPKTFKGKNLKNKYKIRKNSEFA
jgi:hypothetical protein